MKFLDKRRAAAADKTEVAAIVRAALDDDVLSTKEEDDLLALLESKDWTWERFVKEFPQESDAVVVARINDGRVPVVENPQLMAKRDELVHAEVAAGLAKEVVDRQFRGGSTGVSFRVAKGVRFRVGQFQGHSVVVGSHLEVADSGLLSVTSQRIVFQGERKTVECAYNKLVGLQLYTDAIQVSVTNRQKPSVFWVGKPEVLAAAINAAAQQVL